MWKSICHSVRGTAHERVGSVCQDAGLVAHVTFADAEALLAICSDGAGSARHAEVGSQRAGESLRHVLAGAGHLASEAIDLDHLLGWIRQAREAILREAEARSEPVREFACTLLVALLLPERSLFAQIGDGAIVVKDGDDYVPVFWPQAGEYAGTTHFLTQESWETAMALELRHNAIEEVAMFTDGLERLALRFSDRTAHAPFFAPLFAALNGCEDAAALSEPLRAFLSSPAVNERTDDDKTLLLAIRNRRDDATDSL